MTTATATARRLAAVTAAPLLALGLAACGSTVSTSNFKGEQHAVAQTMANFQSHASAGEHKKICEQDLARPAREKLGGQAGCEQAIKRQLTETDNLELSVQSVTVAPPGAKTQATAQAQAKSTYAGKKRTTTVNLVKENGQWRIAGL
jgi:hypothetical protein